MRRDESEKRLNYKYDGVKLEMWTVIDYLLRGTKSTFGMKKMGERGAQ